MPDAGGEGIIDGGMTERALDAHGIEAPLAVKMSSDPNHCVKFEQGQSGSRIIKVDLTVFDLLHQLCGKRVSIDFQTNTERRLRADTRADTTVLLPSNCLMKTEGAAPKGFVTESIEPENLLALLEHLRTVLLNLLLKAGASRVAHCGCTRLLRHQQEHTETKWNRQKEYVDFFHWTFLSSGRHPEHD